MHVYLLRVAGLTAGVALLIATFGRADENPPAPQQSAEPQPSDNSSSSFGTLFRREISPEQFDAWRKKFAVQSLAPRLKYEKATRVAEAPALGAAAEAALKTDDEQADFVFATMRSKSLENLHTLEVEEFINRSGNGLSRMTPPGPSYLEPRQGPPVDVEALVLSADELRQPRVSQMRGEQAASPVADSFLGVMPSRDDVIGFHQNSRAAFADNWSFGWVRGADQVAGFTAHGFYYLPPAPVDAAQRPTKPVQTRVAAAETPKLWKIARLELVSLLKHDEPCVYESDHLPRMEELSSATAPTRALNAFESAALKKLYDGEEVQTASTPNRIEMLGAVRASKACLQCHEVPRGTMLGAFSYELRRDPPIKVHAARTANVQ